MTITKRPDTVTHPIGKVLEQYVQNKNYRKMEEEEELEKRINKALSFLREIETLDEQRVMNAWEAGKIFAEIKKQKSGTYWKWLKSASKRLSFSAVTASRYKKIADAFPTEAEIKEVASGGLTKVYKLAAEKMHEGNGTTSKKKEDESDAGDTSSEKENQLHRGLSSIRKTVTKFCKVTKEYPPEKWGASDIAQFLDAYDEMKKIAEKLEEHLGSRI